MPIRVNDELTIPVEALTFTASRSGGPGGQHVNKTSSRVTLRVDLARGGFLTEGQPSRLLEKLGARIAADGTVRVVAQTSRSQHANRRAAEERLAALFAGALAPELPRVGTKVPKRSKAARLDTKKKRSAVKRLRSRATED